MVVCIEEHGVRNALDGPCTSMSGGRGFTNHPKKEKFAESCTYYVEKGLQVAWLNRANTTNISGRGLSPSRKAFGEYLPRNAANSCMRG